MNAIARLARRLTSDRFDASIGSKLLYGGALLIFVLGVLKLTRLGLTEVQLVFGLLLSICVTMQVIVAGMLLEMKGRLSGLSGEKAISPLRAASSKGREGGR